ncbi:MAG: SGNH/GDSL hydrolase family protein, partial [Planctomycetes bacterium]|nr:SGNH/GDSL hydrolase family protein [Planctomycetota bacterium]
MMNAETMMIVSLGVVLGLGAAANAQDKAAVQPPEGAPEYEAPPRPTDGVNMALTVEKLEKGFDPERPLLIWAIGSSFTNGLGDGSALVEMLKSRFPNMPKVTYKRMAGNSTPYHLTRGWARHLVIPEQPDVVLIYNFGKAEDVEKLVVDLRQHTTADIIVGTLHWCIPHKPLWGKPDEKNGHQDPQAMRAICQKHGVEFVENRIEITDYMTKHNLAVEALLRDGVHQTAYAAKMTNMNIARHFNRPAKFGYDPRSRERRIEAKASEAVKITGDWAQSKSGSSVRVAFTGHRIDLIGSRSPQGGSVDVRIDGRPADQLPVFYAGYIQPDPKNAPAPPNPPRDRSPHRISLGANIVPQKWTLTMTNDTGDYELVGSVTGPDGTGNAKQPFTSKSGQIIVEPEFWRQPETNRTGDKFTFEVFRSIVGRVEFKGDKAK